MIQLQNLVPAGAPIFAWVALPMYFDFNRNQIFPTSEYGFSNPFAGHAVGGGCHGQCDDFSRQRGIRYFIWEYQGYGIKPEAQLGGLQRNFIQILTELLPASKILYNDGNTIVFDIGPFAKTS